MSGHIDQSIFSLLMDISEGVREASNQNVLNRAQIRALKTLKDASPEEFLRVTAKVEESSNTAIKPDSKKSAQIELKDLRGEKSKVLQKKWLSEKRCGKSHYTTPKKGPLVTSH